MKDSILRIGILSLLILFSASVFANKTSVTVIAPEKATKGSEITVKVEVKHIGNTARHYTDRIVLKINGEEYKKWEYNKKSLPDNQNFTVEVKVKADQNLEIIAEGNCNKHGSKGEDKATVLVE